MLRWVARVAAFIAGASLLAVAAWYAVSFLPHIGELQAIAVRGNASVGGIENVLYPLAVAGESKEGLRSWAVRQAYRSLVYEKTRGQMLSWHANNTLWYGASRLHLNERQVFGLWVECAIAGCGYGLKEAARKYFGKELTQLSERELAGLVAAVRNPTMFAPGSDCGEKRTKEILEKAKTHNNTLAVL